MPTLRQVSKKYPPTLFTWRTTFPYGTFHCSVDNMSYKLNYTERNNTYFPDAITLFEDDMYDLHGRLYYVTSRNGHHFYTFCYKVYNGRKCLVKIYNLRNNIRILTSVMDKARIILQTSSKTVYARNFF